MYKFTWKLYEKTLHAWNSIQFLIETSKDDFRRLIKSEVLNMLVLYFLVKLWIYLD